MVEIQGVCSAYSHPSVEKYNGTVFKYLPLISKTLKTPLKYGPNLGNT